MRERKRDIDGWCGRRKSIEGGELVENTIWEGGKSVVVEVMKRMRV